MSTCMFNVPLNDSHSPLASHEGFTTSIIRFLTHTCSILPIVWLANAVCRLEGRNVCAADVKELKSCWFLEMQSPSVGGNSWWGKVTRWGVNWGKIDAVAIMSLQWSMYNSMWFDRMWKWKRNNWKSAIKQTCGNYFHQKVKFIFALIN